MTAGPQIGRSPVKAPLEIQLKRYHRSYRRRLRRLIGGSRQLTDLIYTFPAAALLFAVGQGSAVARKTAIGLVGEGAELRRVAEALGLPYWLRRLPPEAFAEPIGLLAGAPGSEAFAHRIVNHIPGDAAAARMWLAWLLQADRLAGEGFALWIAQQDIFSCEEVESEPLLPLAAYAWYSQRAGTEGRGLIRRTWTPNQGFARAVDEARNFIVRIVLDHCRDDKGVHGRWFVLQRVSGFRFVPLRKPAELEHEGEAMHNCVANYARIVASGECLIYGIRRGNAHVATLEVRAFMGHPAKPVVAQLEGPGNVPASEAVTRAVETWIARQGSYPVIGSGKLSGITIDANRWVDLWAPYRAACEPAARFGALPVGAQLMRLSNGLATLAHLAKGQN